MIIIEGVFFLDMVKLLRKVEIMEILIVGLNCVGIIILEKLLLGIYLI